MSTPEFPQRLTGAMWWSNPDERSLAEVVLLATGLRFAVWHDNGPYEATLRRLANGSYAGRFFFSGKLAGDVSCTITPGDTGRHHLKGEWRQNGRPFPWNAELECE